MKGLKISKKKKVINDLVGRKCILRKFTDNTKQRRVVDAPNICAGRTLTGWISAASNLIEFNKEKFEALYQRRNNPICQHNPGADWLESSFTEKDLLSWCPSGHQIDHEPAMCSCSKESHELPGLHKAKNHQKVDCSPLLFPGETKSKVLCLVLVSPVQERKGHIGARLREKKKKMVKGLEHLSYEERMEKKEGLFSLKKRRIWENLLRFIET